MGKKDKKSKKGKGAEKTAMKTEKKLIAKQRKLLEKLKEDDITEIVARLEAKELQVKPVEEVCPPPTPRSSFTLVCHPEKEELILFGGEFFNGQKMFVYNDMLLYNINKGEWRIMRSPSGPAPRSGHQMVPVSIDGGQLWLFGGEYTSPSQVQFYHYKDLWVMRLRSKKWEKISSPRGPSARSGHRMVVVKKKIVVFGGFHDNNHSYQYYNDLHMFSLETYSWLEIDLGSSLLPSPRSGCCMAASLDGRILIWGGYSKFELKRNSERGMVHTDMFALVPESSKYKWIKLKPGGFKPLPRSSVGCATGPNNKVYCFGGVMDTDEDEEDISGQFGNELLEFDLCSQMWRLLNIEKKTKLDKSSDAGITTVQPLEAAQSKTTTSGDFTVTVMGPSTTSTILNDPKACPSPNSNFVPTPRMNPGMCVCKGKLYVFGGVVEDDKKQITLNDFYFVDLHKLNEWKVLIPNANAHEWIDSDDSSNSSNTEEEDEFDDIDSSDDSDESAMETS